MAEPGIGDVADEVDGLADHMKESQEDGSSLEEQTEQNEGSASADSTVDSGGNSREGTGVSHSYEEDGQENTGSAASEKQDLTSAQCEEITRSGSRCKHDARPGSNYCKKHQPDKFGHRAQDFQRKQWNLLPVVHKELFKASSSESLYIRVQDELDVEFQKKTLENKMGQFLLEHREEFIEFVAEEYAKQQ